MPVLEEVVVARERLFENLSRRAAANIYNIPESALRYFTRRPASANLVALKWVSHFAEISKNCNGTRQYFIDLV